MTSTSFLFAMTIYGIVHATRAVAEWGTPRRKHISRNLWCCYSLLINNVQYRFGSGIDGFGNPFIDPSNPIDFQNSLSSHHSSDLYRILVEKRRRRRAIEKHSCFRDHACVFVISIRYFISLIRLFDNREFYYE